MCIAGSAATGQSDMESTRGLLLLCLAVLLCAGQCELQKGNDKENLTLKTFYSVPVDDFEDFPDDAIDASGEESGYEPNMPNFRSRSVITEIKKNITTQAEHYLSDQWLTRIVPSVYTLVFIVALPLNVIAIIIFLFKMKVKKPAVVYMLNLAAADVLFVSVLPFNIIYRFSGNDWLFGSGMCRFVTAAFYCNMYCSILLMTSISVDRFLAVVYPMHSLSWRTMSRAWLVCSLIWIISIASVVPLFLSEQTQHIASLEITTCHDVLDLKDLKTFYLYYFSTFILLFFFFPLIITTISYVFIIRCLSSSGIENSCKKTRALVLAVIVLCVFIMCFGPTNCIFLVHYLYFYHGANESLYFAYILCACFSSISCCLDPLIYYYASSQCQRYLYRLLCCKKADEPISSSAHLMSSASKNETGITSVKNSIYRKLLT
ncbi:proteinase-activated receptor 1-like [Hyla sarda]|uniref:proteinase-activated receptor 1-like n=1 Tax=Hyla sarda TaxID=327740 RepID=UPI0024C2BA31|nr:proteinase-activated receptor 1-like [Hyla sarda]